MVKPSFEVVVEFNDELAPVSVFNVQLECVTEVEEDDEDDDKLDVFLPKLDRPFVELFGLL